MANAVDLDALAEAARLATPGARELREYPRAVAVVAVGRQLARLPYGKSMDAQRVGQCRFDAAFIAACDPDTILSLIAMARSATAPDGAGAP